jgi:hypothetical protein
VLKDAVITSLLDVIRCHLDRGIALPLFDRPLARPLVPKQGSRRGMDLDVGVTEL